MHFILFLSHMCRDLLRALLNAELNINKLTFCDLLKSERLILEINLESLTLIIYCYVLLFPDNGLSQQAKLVLNFYIRELCLLFESID